jgi:alpha-L-rhamnosidase
MAHARLVDNAGLTLAYKIASHTTYPSWGYMASQGATPLGVMEWQYSQSSHEFWKPCYAVRRFAGWFYEYLAGIKSYDKDMAFKTIIMIRIYRAGLTFCKSHYFFSVWHY